MPYTLQAMRDMTARAIYAAARNATRGERSDLEEAIRTQRALETAIESLFSTPPAGATRERIEACVGILRVQSVDWHCRQAIAELETYALAGAAAMAGESANAAASAR